MGLNKVLQQLGHLSPVRETVLGDDGGREAAQGGEVQGVDLAAGDGLQHVGRALGARVADVDMGAVGEQQVDDLEGQEDNNLDVATGSLDSERLPPACS